MGLGYGVGYGVGLGGEGSLPRCACCRCRMATRSISGRASAAALAAAPPQPARASAARARTARSSASKPPSPPRSTPLLALAPSATLTAPAATPLVPAGGRGPRPGGRPRPGGPPPTPLVGRGAGETAGVPRFETAGETAAAAAAAASAGAGASAAAWPLDGAAAGPSYQTTDIILADCHRVCFCLFPQSVAKAPWCWKICERSWTSWLIAASKRQHVTFLLLNTKIHHY